MDVATGDSVNPARWSFELCVESARACRVAEEGGATRVELCARLDVGGVTPPMKLIRECVAATSLPVHGMVRPRDGSFLYTSSEFAEMEDSVRMARGLGLRGVVFGLLLEDGSVDVARTSSLVALAKAEGLEVTFHRAMDDAAMIFDALEDVIDCGVNRVLSSGGAADVVHGVEVLVKMRRQAAGRVVVATGGGVRVSNVPLLVGMGLLDLHGTLAADGAVKVEDVRAVVGMLHAG
ncbi:copper homeostasis protein CutC [Terriglobus saanensis]|uniref:PF03932 family protein CutC n=1 Tax=Terriglobus saanensis (strain ATCC BAA-1853 / DSM 23119 / SP1PR4) TaxID=401053 RepID=E8V726_TERSS|nr:copper homeostasis protein CutC [Terriglobus saanensis]ADV81666.1 CutC family protein [Terriglobus saanensis SP1PR4]